MKIAEQEVIISHKRDNKPDNVGPFYAHSKEGEPPENWRWLENHLKTVAELTREFAAEFGAGELALQSKTEREVIRYERQDL